ncbi:MAG: aspartyl protease family protein [Candidatus Dadabacteria bacterium]
MKRLAAFLLFSCFLQACVAQEEFVTPSRYITSFKFLQLTGGVILLQGRFDSYPDTLNFILDTGSGGISLDSTTADYFKITPTPSNRTIRGIAGVKMVSFINNKKLHLPGLTIDSLNFHVNNYDILTSVYGERIDGIIGYSVFSRYIIKLDYDSSIIEFWSRGSIKYPRGGFLIKPTINTLPVHSARIKDAREITTRVLYDMGAGLNLMLSTDFIKDSSFLLKGRRMYVKEAEGLGGKIDLQMTVIKEVRVGPYRFRNVPVDIFDDTYNITSYPYLGGIMGNDILRRFNAIINYERRDIYLIPNSHFTESFDYSYSGLALYFVEGRIIIGDVSAGSPAEKAGVKEGDIVVAINKNFNQNLQTYKAAIQATGEWLKLIILRDGGLIEFNFKVKSILRK